MRPVSKEDLATIALMMDENNKSNFLLAPCEVDGISATALAFIDEDKENEIAVVALVMNEELFNKVKMIIK